MDKEWVTQTIQESIEKHGCPEIINTDQGSQYTSELFSSTVLSHGIKLSMDGRGRATDNAFIERLWRTVKYEKVYLNPSSNGTELYHKLDEYLKYYNEDRRHSMIGDKRPIDLFLEQLKVAA